MPKVVVAHWKVRRRREDKRFAASLIQAFDRLYGELSVQQLRAIELRV